MKEDTYEESHMRSDGFYGFVGSFPHCAGVFIEKDIIERPASDLEITFIGHGILIFEIDGKIVHIDPYLWQVG